MKVLLGMSGGVDSSAAAALLKERGYEVIGATLLLDRNTCAAEKSGESAAEICRLLGIPHVKLELFDKFDKTVKDYFANAYLCGDTPNPCIVCNRFIKFGALLDYADKIGCEFIATGHYAEVEKKGCRYLLKRPSNSNKEQTYVLYRLTQEQLSRVIFPLAGLDKSEIREIAAKYAMPCAQAPDSQDICFVPDGDYAAFIERYTGVSPLSGNFIDSAGEILGRHRGIVHYTVGQRKGLGIAFGEPRYVISKDASSGNVVLGTEEELFSAELTACDVSWIIDEPDGEFRALAKTRYAQREQPALITPLGDGQLKIRFDRPQRAITSGQSAVIYDENGYVLGGGRIMRK